MPHQRCREWARRRLAVGRERSGLGRERHQGIRRRGLDARQAAADRARRAPHRLGERIVAAGIEHDESQPFGRLDRAQDAIERDRLVLDVEVACKPRVDRDQIVGPVDLDAVARIEQQRHIGVARGLGEIAERLAHRRNAEIAAHIHAGKTGHLEQERNRGRVIGRITEHACVLVIRIADDKRDALFGLRR